MSLFQVKLYVLKINKKRKTGIFTTMLKLTYSCINNDSKLKQNLETETWKHNIPKVIGYSRYCFNRDV